MEDVWITASNKDQLPRWLEDVDVRNGIKALLKSDRCQEEQERLAMETDNMCRWFGNKLACIEVALRLSDCELVLSCLVSVHSYILTRCSIFGVTSTPALPPYWSEAPVGQSHGVGIATRFTC